MPDTPNSFSDIQRTKLSNLCNIKAFIGREFLTWLWYLVENSADALKVHCAVEKRTYTLDLWIEDYLIFESPSSMAHTQTLRGGTPSQSIEATAALKTGKSLKQMKIGMSIEGLGEFSACLTDNNLFPRGLKFTRVHDEGEQNADNLSVRLEMIETFLKVLDLLYSDFIAIRTQKNWENHEARKIRFWIGKRHLDQIVTKTS